MRNLLLHAQSLARGDSFDREKYAFGLALELGQPWERSVVFSAFELQLPSDFQGLLRAVEYLVSQFPKPQSSTLGSWIADAIDDAPGTLGIRWDGRTFWPSSAPELDTALGEYPLSWLTDHNLEGASIPFGRALRALVDADADPTAAKNSVRDAYEALECAARAVLGNRRDLSANRDRLIAHLHLAPPLVDSLKSYITWGNDHRHAGELDGFQDPSAADAEAFVFLTGTFLRRIARVLDGESES